MLLALLQFVVGEGSIVAVLVVCRGPLREAALELGERCAAAHHVVQMLL